MPTFRTTPSSNLSSTMRALAQSQGGLSLADEQAVDRLAASHARTLSLVDKAREESEARRNAQRLREDPAAQAEFASDVAGVGIPTGVQLFRHDRGLMDPNPQGPADVADNVYGDVRAPMPTGVSQEQTRLFKAALAALAGNRMATGNTNAQQLMEAARSAQRAKFAAESTAPGMALPRSNQLIAAGEGRIREPFSGVSNEGLMVQQETGEIFEEPRLAGLVRERVGSQTALNRSREVAAREGRAAPKRTPAQEARDNAAARRSQAEAEKRERENLAEREREVKRRHLRDPAMKGTTLGPWDPQRKGFQVLKGGQVIGVYD